MVSEVVVVPMGVLDEFIADLFFEFGFDGECSWVNITAGL
jgi:hypothetical protein